MKIEPVCPICLRVLLLPPLQVAAPPPTSLSSLFNTTSNPISIFMTTFNCLLPDVCIIGAPPECPNPINYFFKWDSLKSTHNCICLAASMLCRTALHSIARRGLQAVLSKILIASGRGSMRKMHFFQNACGPIQFWVPTQYTQIAINMTPVFVEKMTTSSPLESPKWDFFWLVTLVALLAIFSIK